MLGYLGVQKYIGTEILKHKIILELKFMKNPQRLILQFVFHRQGLLCVCFVCNITSVHHMLFRVVHYWKTSSNVCKMLYETVLKKLLNFRMEMQFFATSQRSVSQQANVCFAGVFKTEPQKLCNNERDCSQRGLPSPLLILLLISSALNIVTEWSPKER